jgi:hypothetical protein
VMGGGGRVRVRVHAPGAPDDRSVRVDEAVLGEEDADGDAFIVGTWVAIVHA